MRGVRALAIFLVYLIVSINIVGAATYIQYEKIEGEDGIPNVRKETDTLKVDVLVHHEATVAEPIFSPENLHLGIINTIYDIPFTKCDLISENNYLCSVEFKAQPLHAGIYPINAYYSDTSSTSTLLIDGLPPQIDNSSLQYSYDESTRSYKIDFNVTDYACDDCNSTCSGIKKVESYDSNGQTKFGETNIGTTDCTYIGSIIVNSANIRSGERKVCLFPSDMLEQKSFNSTGCIKIIVDNTPPELVSVNFYKHNSDDKVTFIPISGLYVDIVAIVKSDFATMYKNQVYADLSEMSDEVDPDVISNLQIVGFVCEYSGGEYWKCVNEDFYARRSSAGSFSVSLTGKDDLGNSFSKTVESDLKSDMVNPEIISIKSANTYGGKYFVGPNKNTFTAEIKEDDSGLKYAALENIGDAILGTCKQKSKSIYECVWSEISYGQNSIRIFVEDNAGNRNSGSIGLIQDSENPVIINITTGPKCVTSDDILSINITAEESISGLSYSIDAKKISTHQGKITGTCAKNNETDNFDCNAKIGFIMSMEGNHSFLVSVIDTAGNVESSIITKEFCEPDVESTPNVLAITAGQSVPEALSRQSISVYPYKVYVPLNIGTAPDTIIFSQQVICDNQTAETTLMNQYSDTATPAPVISLKIKPISDTNNVSELKIHCVINSKVRQGFKLYNKLEEDNVTINLKLKDSSLGTLDEGAKAKLNSIYDSTQNTKSKIKTLEKWNNILGGIASLQGILLKLNLAIQVVTSILQIIFTSIFSACYACIPSPIVGAACFTCAMKAYTGNLYACESQVNAASIVDGFIFTPSLFDFSKLITTGYYLKIYFMLYSCQLCATDLFGTITGGAVGAGATMSLTTSQTSNSFKTTWIGTPSKDPYKSLPLANNCLCLPGILYGYKKQLQIECMQYKCVKSSLEKGLPVYACDESYKQRYCAYVDGGKVQKYTLQSISSSILDLLLKFIVPEFIGLGYNALCYRIIGNGDRVAMCASTAEPGEMWFSTASNVACSALETGIHFMQYDGYLSNEYSFKEYNVVPEGDFCQGVERIE